ncbi:MAG: hypothetical protein GW762_02945 [Candidatus Pacebacteria bacterium]|nr:hypothetical protein [Candidatus Paceibacterota bacterium]PIR63418.1 MAG: hypothetical protein COU64_04440 [Candidatus Pacebacteria bacterium CG10_big_fil_rev_8_21_14_0_10_40_26]PIZ79555.1 MAG: hypothetical protein COY01_00340 [Candidatus Pacebacteria bacterium CG_4_10_14_0_2_um_filter_40_20]PJA69008.1 MAG: hypothetical protein CO156_01590 [Candidatus Pacebacteria bacterium CG_4_9_14_3_um_filter_40_12]PJC41859.1 MAG: hypothetical protein CO041_04015 [Candidatus Pacebacteria bacterium CG_4_9_
MKNKTNYYSSDLSLVTTLSLDFPIIGIDRRNPSRIIFEFESSRELSARIKEYWNAELFIEPQRFFTQLKYIKAQVFGRPNAE